MENENPAATFLKKLAGLDPDSEEAKSIKKVLYNMGLSPKEIEEKIAGFLNDEGLPSDAFLG